MGAHRKIICALDTGNLDEAILAVKRLSPYVGGFKIGHALTLPNGLDVVDRLRDAGANRIFLDLKFHDIPNSVALAVREAGKRGVWMVTIHASGGQAMMVAAAEEAAMFDEDVRPQLLAVSVLTSLDGDVLSKELGIQRTVSDQMVSLSKLAVSCGIDGVVCSAEEVKALRSEVGHAVIVTPGIRRDDQSVHDHARTGTATQALSDGADYLVIGRGLMSADDPVATLAAYGLMSTSA